MKRQWANKKVNLALLSGCLERFFKEKGLETRVVEGSLERRRISVTSPDSAVLSENIDVEIVGNLGSLSIGLEIGSGSRWTLMSSLLTLIGGGGIVLRKLKAQEALDKLEKEFWTYVEELVAGSSETSQRLC